MIITHIVARDKFTTGYINFFKKCMPEHVHYFVINKAPIHNAAIEVEDDRNIYYIDNYLALRLQRRIMQRLRESDKIIVSGLFESRSGIVTLPRRLMRRTYIHFWGGDFYGYMDPPKSLRSAFKRILVYRLYRNAAGFAFLIDGEYEEFVKITGIRHKHFVAPMPSPITRNYKKICEDMPPHQGIHIIVGNSATDTNCHFEVFQKIKKFVDEDISVYCPLSYGDSAYRDTVIAEGNKLFGNKFHAVLELIPENEYIRFLNQMDIGIFAQNRQQGMGNTLFMLSLGKKVFLRTGTSSSKRFSSEFWTFPFEEIDALSFSQFCFFDQKNAVGNILHGQEKEDHAVNNYKQKWDYLFSDQISGK